MVLTSKQTTEQPCLRQICWTLSHCAVRCCYLWYSYRVVSKQAISFKTQCHREQKDNSLRSKMTSKKVIELFYDVVSPYSWLGFEVCFHFMWAIIVKSEDWLQLKLLTSRSLFQVMCRYRNVWNIELKLRPAFLGGVMNESGTWRRWRSPSGALWLLWNLSLPFIHIHMPAVCTVKLKQCFSFLTGNKPPGLVPNKFLYMTKDMERLAEYFNVPLTAPSDPFHVMFKKGRYKLD